MGLACINFVSVTLICTDELEQFETDCNELFSHFQHRNVDALVASVKSTLDALRRRITASSSGRGSSRVYPTSVSSYTEESSSRQCSCFMAELVLSLPNIIIQPSLEEIQNTVNQAVQMVSEIGQKIPLWTHPNPSSSQNTPRAGATQSQSKASCIPMFTLIIFVSLTRSHAPYVHVARLSQVQPATNYFRIIHDSKDVLKLTSVLSSAILASRQDLMKVHDPLSLKRIPLRE